MPPAPIGSFSSPPSYSSPGYLLGETTSNVFFGNLDDLLPSKITGKGLYALSTLAASSKIDEVVAILQRFLGENIRAIKPRQPGSDLILRSQDNTHLKLLALERTQIDVVGADKTLTALRTLAQRLRMSNAEFSRLTGSEL